MKRQNNLNQLTNQNKGMKKNDCPSIPYWNKILESKLCKVMKTTLFLVLVTISQVIAVGAYSQNTRINLNMRNVTIKDVLVEIERKSEFFFMYDANYVNVNQKVDISAENLLITNILDDILKNKGISYSINNRQIALNSIGFIDQKVDNKTILGKVVDTSGVPLPGVSVVLKGTTIGTITDVNGNYSLSNIPENATLLFSFVGMKKLEIATINKTTINVTLVEEAIGIDEVVAIGYGSQRKIEITSAVASVNSDGFVKGSVKDAAQLIQGKVAGIIIGTPSGDPNARSQILLRGTATFATSTQPLILIDGIPGDLNTVQPEDIETIDVLKDGSAAAIYGTRGTNGVILIATKRASGSTIEPTIEFSSYISTQNYVRLPKMLTADEYRARLTQGVTFQDYGASTDWIKEISRNTPLSHNQNLTFRGGNTKTNYLASIAYRDQQGIFITSETKNFNGRFDINHRMFNDKLIVGINYINSKNNSGVPFENYFFRQATRYNPTAPVKNPDGSWFENSALSQNQNPVSWLKESYGDNKFQSSRISGSLSWLPVQNLNLKMLVSNSQNNYMNSLGHTKQHYSSTMDGKNGEAYKNFGQNVEQLLELTASYSKSFKGNTISALAGYSYQHSLTERGSMYNYDFPAGNYSYIDAIGNGDALSLGKATMGSGKYASNLIGFFGRVTYNYKEKYLLTANLRYEGASQFVGTKKPWGTFPSVSVGWRINEEDFMKSISFVDNLKLRAGYGVTGTAPDYSFLGVSQLDYGDRFFIDGKWTRGLSPSNNANPYIRWEEKRETNIGLDFGFLKGKLSGSIDYYNRRTDGLLYNYSVPSPPNLYPTTMANVGVMENKGLEVLLNYTPIKTKKFTWNTNATYSANRNKLISIDNDLYKATNPWFNAGTTPSPINIYSHRVEVGQEIGNFWGYKVFDIAADGTWIYEDKDGKQVPKVTEADKKVIGNGLPKFYLSWNNNLRYGNFDLNVSMRGAFGFQIINAQRMIYEVPGFTVYNQLSSATEKVFGKTALKNTVSPDYNSYYVENGDYLKIDNVTLGYNFSVSGSKHIKSARLYISTLNTLIITGYKGMDPEVNQLGLNPGYDSADKYPSARVYTIGLNITIK